MQVLTVCIISVLLQCQTRAVTVWCFQCQVGLVSSPDLLDVVKAFSTESNYTVWSDLLSNISEMGRLLQYTAAGTPFQSFVCGLLQPVYADLGWENMNPDEEGNTRCVWCV